MATYDLQGVAVSRSASHSLMCSGARLYQILNSLFNDFFSLCFCHHIIFENIEEFINEGIALLLDGKGYEFIELYYNTVNKIYKK